MDMIPRSNQQAVSATGFDYSAVPEGKQVRDAAERIKECGYRINEDMIEIGRELIAVKKMLAHGQFQKWIEAEFGWGKTTVRNFINVARNLGDKSATVAHLAPIALYKLAAPSFPDEVRQEVVERLKKGEKFDADEIKRLGRKAKDHVHTVRNPAASAGPKGPLPASHTRLLMLRLRRTLSGKTIRSPRKIRG